MDNKILELKEKFVSELEKIDNLADIENIRVSYLGKKGSVTDLLKGMKELSNDERKVFGQKVNELKGLVNEKITEKTQELKEKEIQKEIELMPEFDLSMPPVMDRGSYHPITLVQRECERIFKSMGFTVEDYSEIVTDYECFESLNIPKHHPARDMQDTFFISKNPDIVLHTHTSSVQVRDMEAHRPPIRLVTPGRVFRNEAISARAHCIFHQIEALYIDENVSFADLKQTLTYFAKELFGPDTQIRLRPSYFPFTEPSAEMDVSCTLCHGKGCNVCKGTGWLEILGCGMVDPNVLELNGIDKEKYTGFALGMGIERITMLKYGIKDIRLFFENDIRFLEQFSAAGK